MNLRTFIAHRDKPHHFVAYGVEDHSEKFVFRLTEYKDGRKTLEIGSRYYDWSDTYYRVAGHEYGASTPEHAILCATAETLFAAMDSIYQEIKKLELAATGPRTDV